MYRRGASSRGGALDASRFRGRPEALLHAAFRLYYRSGPCIEEPPRIQHREFAFQPFGSDSYVRHISFERQEELLDYLVREAPRQAYYSVALYELPEAQSMEEKGWLGSELLFDLDLDHLPLEECQGPVIGDECLLEGYRLASRLAAMIRRDLAPERILVYFTGHRGFHIRVYCEACLGLGRDERRQIAQYFSGQGVSPTAIFPRPRSPRRGPRYEPAVPGPDEPGWRGWLAPYIRARAPRARGLVEAFGRRWEREVESILEEASIPIDTLVTADPSRLTRILGSLNGKAGLLVESAEEGFRPGPGLSPFRGRLLARLLRELPERRLLGRSLGGSAGEELDLPVGQALYLIAKGLAEPVEGEILVGEGACGGPV